ncbi:MAG: hypothetical protein ABI835_19295 [Chloroflexota bacterium]
MRRILFVCFALIMTIGATFGFAHDGEHEPTLIVYSTVSDLLAGDVSMGATIPEMNEELEAFLPDWAVVGVGTTTQVERNGELMPEGTADAVHYWWVDPSSESMSAVVDLAGVGALREEMAMATPIAGATAEASGVNVDFEPEFPFIGLAVADPEEALTFEMTDVENLHDWIVATLAETDITVAGLQVTGDFGAVSTTVGYNLPPEGIDTSQGTYMSSEHFHFIDYAEPAAWMMQGFYVTDPELDGVVTAVGAKVHLHGFQPEALLGGHIASAIVEHATLTVYPLENVIQLRESDE